MTDPTREELMENLLSLESPFSWAMPHLDLETVDVYLKMQLEKSENIIEEHNFEWTRFNLNLLLGYEFWHQLGDIVNANIQVDKCWEQLEQLTHIDCSEQLFCSILGALWHVVCSAKAHLLMVNGEIQLAALVVSQIRPLQSLTTAEKAGLLGIKAAVFKQYKPVGITQALELATAASKMDPGQAEWHFIIANCLKRLRSLHRSPIITDREVNEMEQALCLTRDATYSCHLGQMLVDKSSYIYHNRFKPEVCESPACGLQISRDYAIIAVDNYRDAVKLRPHCPGLKIRVAHGLLRIADPSVADITFAKELLDEASEHLPNNSMLHHNLGRYYYKFQRDIKQAIRSLKQAHKLNNYPAFLWLVDLWWKYGKDVDLIAEITAALHKYTQDYETVELLVHLGACHLLLREDWAMAVNCFNQSLELDPAAKYMKRFNGFFWKDRKCNLLEIVINELLLKISQDEAITTVLKKFLSRIYFKVGHNLFKAPVNPGAFAEFKARQMAHKLN